MTQEFIPYEQALELKELGFKYGCQRFYNKNKKIKWSFANGLGQEYFNQSDAVAAPLYQQAFRWFREKYNLHFYSFEVNIPYPDDDYPNKVWVGKINDNYVNTQNGLAINHFHTYEEAELACLKKLIETTKNK